jgi:hypothetical protein
MRPFTVFVLVAGIAAWAVPAEAAMYKCATPDGTVRYQAKPCSAGDREMVVSGSVAPVDGANASTERRKLAADDPRLQAVQTPQNAEDRAVLTRDLAQRRDRCRSARETIERQHSLLSSANEVTRQQAGNEIAVQERRMREDRCDAV